MNSEQDHDFHKKRKSVMMAAVSPAQLDKYVSTADQLAIKFLKEWTKKQDFSIVEEWAAWSNVVAFKAITGVEIHPDDAIWMQNDLTVKGIRFKITK
jgi:cytochrome P450